MAKMQTVEIWIKINVNGEYEVGVEADDVDDRFAGAIGDVAPAKYIKLLLDVPVDQIVTTVKAKLDNIPTLVNEKDLVIEEVK